MVERMDEPLNTEGMTYLQGKLDSSLRQHIVWVSGGLCWLDSDAVAEGSTDTEGTWVLIQPNSNYEYYVGHPPGQRHRGHAWHEA